MQKKNASPTTTGNAKTSKTSSAKVVAKKKATVGNIIAFNGAVKPTISDILKIQSLIMDETPDENEPIVLAETWYEYSVFKSKFNVSPGTANKWLANGWLPNSKLDKMRFINKADIEKMMLRFRRNTLLWLGYFITFSNEWEGLVSFDFSFGGL